MLSAPLLARGGGLMVCPVCRLIVTEIEGGSSREQQRHGPLAGRAVIELLRQLERLAKQRSGAGGAAPRGVEADEKLREHA